MDNLPLDIQRIINVYAFDTERFDKVITILTVPPPYRSVNTLRTLRAILRLRDDGTCCLDCNTLLYGRSRITKECANCCY